MELLGSNTGYIECYPSAFFLVQTLNAKTLKLSDSYKKRKFFTNMGLTGFDRKVVGK